MAMITQTEEAITKKVSELTDFDEKVLDTILQTRVIESPKHFDFEEQKQCLN